MFIIITCYSQRYLLIITQYSFKIFQIKDCNCILYDNRLLTFIKLLARSAEERIAFGIWPTCHVGTKRIVNSYIHNYRLITIGFLGKIAQR